MLRDLRARVPLGAKIVSVGALLGVVLSGWLLAAPPGGSPDDGYHLGSIWCADGYQDGICMESVGIADPKVALVPADVLSLACFAYDGAKSAGCLTDRDPWLTGQFANTVTNINGERPNLYYRTMHGLIGEGQDVAVSANRMRAANVMLTALMVMLTALAAPRRLRSAFLLSWIVAALPLGLFFATTVSTSAWSIAGLSTVWANLVTATDHAVVRNRIFGGVLAAVGVTMGLGARTEAVAHLAIVGVSLGAMWWTQYRETRALRTERSVIRRAAELAGLGVGGAIFLALLNAVAPESAGLDSAVGGFRAGYERLDARDVGDPLLAILFEVPTLWSGALGDAWGLGVLDTPIPHIASIPIMVVFVALLAVGLHRGARGRTLAVALIVAGFLAMPTLSLLRSGLLVYESLQPRQFMAMTFPILGLALYRGRRELSLVIGRTMALSVVVTLSAAHSIALLVTMQRHTIGLLPGFDGLPRHVELGRDIEWWWATMPHPDVVWAVASVAYLLLVAALIQPFREPRSSRTIGTPVPGQV